MNKHLSYFLLCMLLINTVNAQCPLYTDILNHGYSGGSCFNGVLTTGNFDEFAVVDDNPFFVKIGSYPPVRAFQISKPCGTFYYFSVDTDDDYLPINYRMLPHVQTVVKTYRFDGTVYTSGFSLMVSPPEKSDLNSAPDFVMKYDGTEHDKGWEDSEDPEWEWNWDNFVTSAQIYTPNFEVVILGANGLDNNSSSEFTADINGGTGEYDIKWYKRSLPSGIWSNVQDNPIPNNFLDIGCNSTNLSYYYDSEHKYILNIGVTDIELKVEVRDILSGITLIATKIITVNSAPITVKNILNEDDYGQLTVDSLSYNSGDVAYLKLNEEHSFETYSVLQNGNYLFRDWSFNTNQTSYLSTDNLFINLEQTVSSHLYPTIPLKVTNNLEGGSGGTWQVKWDKKANFEPPINSGVSFYAFDNDETIDEYTLNAQTVSALGTNWQFRYWGNDPDDNNPSKTDVQVKSTTSNNYTANYKGQFRSNSTDAFSANSQRKLARTDDGIYHLVYESYGEIWYTPSQTTNFNGNWDFELHDIEYL